MYIYIYCARLEPKHVQNHHLYEKGLYIYIDKKHLRNFHIYIYLHVCIYPRLPKALNFGVEAKRPYKNEVVLKTLKFKAFGRTAALWDQVCSNIYNCGKKPGDH